MHVFPILSFRDVIQENMVQASKEMKPLWIVLYIHSFHRKMIDLYLYSPTTVLSYLIFMVITKNVIPYFTK